ncbi:MAG: T9SS type A sorting domain-containing protein [Cytophagales bacterium]|nr:T9SS type A sorting domain-containing protein [Cytophagales bacterium]
MLTISANLSITGDLIITTSGSVTQAAGIFDIGTGGNNQDINIDGGSLSITGGSTNIHGLLIGINSSTIAFTGGTILIDDEIDIFSGTSLSVSTTLTSVNQDDIEIDGNASMTVSAGALITGFDDLQFIGDGGSYTQTGGVTSFEDQIEIDGTNATINISGGTMDIAFDINFAGGAGNQVNVSGTGTVTTTEITGTNQNTSITGGGTMVVGGVVLPVDLLYFKASRESSEILLEWATASEINNDHFEIEKSFDGINFSKSIEVSGSGNSSDQVKYNYVDMVAQNGDVYYRLSQVDFDGTSETYNTIFVGGEIPENNISIYPNPSDGANLTLRSLSSEANTGLVIIYNLKGNVISKHHLAFNESQISMNPKLPKGIYFAKIQIGLQIVTKKFVVNK